MDDAVDVVDVEDVQDDVEMDDTGFAYVVQVVE